MLVPGPSGTKRRIRPNPLCEGCYTNAKAEHLRKVHNNLARQRAASKAAEAAAAARAASKAAEEAAAAARAAQKEAERKARAEAQAEARRAAAAAKEAKAREEAARGVRLEQVALELRLPPSVATYVRALPSSRWGKLVERLDARKGSPDVVAAKLLGLSWEDADGKPLIFNWQFGDQFAPRDARTPDHFECEHCGRWADTVDAGNARRATIEAVGMSPEEWERLRRAPSPIIPAMLQRDFGMSFQAARSFLATVERAGLLQAEKRGYSHVGARCSTCHGYRTDEPVVWASSLREAIPAQLRYRVLQRDSFRCQYCGRSARDGATLHLDHVVPYSAGGETTEDNLITACEQCNLGKSASSVIPD